MSLFGFVLLNVVSIGTAMVSIHIFAIYSTFIRALIIDFHNTGGTVS